MSTPSAAEQPAGLLPLAVGFVRQVIDIVVNQQISGFAQMVAYNLLFATAPLLMVVTGGAAALTRAINRGFENPAQPVLTWMQDTLPPEASAFLQAPIDRVVNAETSWLFSIGAVLALWGARAAVAAVIRGLNVAYGIGKEPRHFLVHTTISLALTIMLVLLIAVGGVVFTLGTNLGNRIANALGLGTIWTEVSQLIRWPLIAAIAVVAVMTLHRYGPAERGPFKWYLPGSIFTVLGMYVTSVVLGYWFGRSANLSESYGVFGSMLAFITWLYLMGFIILLGGVINAVLHRQFAVSKESRLFAIPRFR